MSSLYPTGPPILPGYRHLYSGKVRDLYEPEPAHDGTFGGGTSATGDVVLVVASDRVSAYDHVLPTPIRDKGRVLTALSLWWFERLADVVPNHVLACDGPSVPEAVRGRAMLCRRLRMFPVECVARGYLAGSGLADYRATGAVCGVPLPDGLRDGDRLPEPIFTPATKADLGEHDENVDLARVQAVVGGAVAARLCELTLTVYRRAEAVAREHGILLADTKLEFGVEPGAGDDEAADAGDAGDAQHIVLGDEVLTPDSSRFWPVEGWQPGRTQPSFDKQYVRDWLTSPASGWRRETEGPPPPLPDDVVERTRGRYIEAYQRITGRSFT